MQNPNESKMLNAQGNMCCLGQIAAQCGVPASQLAGRDGPSDVFRSADGFLVTQDLGVMNSQLSRLAMGINDSRQLKQSTRERNLRKLFAEHDVRLRFTGKLYGTK